MYYLIDKNGELFSPQYKAPTNGNYCETSIIFNFDVYIVIACAIDKKCRLTKYEIRVKDTESLLKKLSNAELRIEKLNKQVEVLTAQNIKLGKQVAQSSTIVVK